MTELLAASSSHSVSWIGKGLEGNLILGTGLLEFVQRNWENLRSVPKISIFVAEIWSRCLENMKQGHYSLDLEVRWISFWTHDVLIGSSRIYIYSGHFLRGINGSRHILKIRWNFHGDCLQWSFPENSRVKTELVSSFSQISVSSSWVCGTSHDEEEEEDDITFSHCCSREKATFKSCVVLAPVWHLKLAGLNSNTEIGDVRNSHSLSPPPNTCPQALQWVIPSHISCNHRQQQRGHGPANVELVAIKL